MSYTNPRIKKEDYEIIKKFAKDSGCTVIFLFHAFAETIKRGEVEFPAVLKITIKEEK